MSISENYNDEVHAFYETAKRLADTDILNLGKKIAYLPDDEERDFLLNVSTYFLQKRQKDVIKKGLF
jgi:hypothetical protein